MRMDSVNLSDLEKVASLFRQNMSDKDLKRFSVKRKSIDYNKKYEDDPYGYLQDILQITLWYKQKEVVDSFLENQMTLVRSCNLAGKSFIVAALVSLAFDVYDPSIILTTAPTESQVKDILWREIRNFRKGRDMLPKAPRMETSPNHFAEGFTTTNADAFQGRHGVRNSVFFDEAAGVSNVFWSAMKSMVNKTEDRFVGIYNPLNRSSYVYQEEMSGAYNVITISALDHPNIAAELAGLPAPYPDAVRLRFILNGLKTWCTPIEKNDVKASDVEFPPGSGDWYRPGAEFEARVLGRWPSQSMLSVWNEGSIDRAETEPKGLPDFKNSEQVRKFVLRHGLPEIGCDVARTGEDKTVIMVRWGKSIVYCESYQGQLTNFTASRLKDLAKTWSQRARVGRHKIPVKIDDAGVGGGVVDQAQDRESSDDKVRYRFIGIGGARQAIRVNKYFNRRTELWLTTAEMADNFEIEWSRLLPEDKKRIRTDILGVEYGFDNRDRKKLEKKEITKDRLGKSPDFADCLMLVCTNFSRQIRVQKQSSNGKTENLRTARLAKIRKKNRKNVFIPS